MTNQTWTRYLRATAHPDNDTVIAGKVGVSSSTIGRWRSGDIDPKPRQVVAFARAYGKSPLAALVAAGYLSEEDLEGDLTLRLASDLDEVSTLQLVDELRTRIEVMNDYAGWIGSIDSGAGHPVSMPAGRLRYLPGGTPPADVDGEAFIRPIAEHLSTSDFDGSTMYRVANDYTASAENDLPLYKLEELRRRKANVRPLSDDLEAVARAKDDDRGEDTE